MPQGIDDALGCNAFLESLIGLWDYGQVAGDRGAQTLFAKGDREARHELRLLDTGAWTLYQLHGAESDLNYQRVLSYLYSAKTGATPLDFAFFARVVNVIFDDPAAVQGGVFP